MARSKPLLAANLTLTKSGPSAAFPGDTLTYTMAIANAGPDASGPDTGRQ